MTDPIHICVCADAPVRVGLHVVLGSAARALGEGAQLHVTLVDLGLASGEPDLLRETLRRAGKPFTLDIVSADFAAFKDLHSLRKLYGSSAPYFKLVLPSQIKDASRIIFLDTDVVVCADLSALFCSALRGHVAGCVPEGPITIAPEGPYFQRCGFAPDSLYFNSGVMLIDLDRWQREDISAQCLALIRRDTAEMFSADQTALNVVLRERHQPLPAMWNQLAFPNVRAIRPETAQGLYHLVGRPKPWEPFGEIVNRQGRFFTHHLDHTALAGWRSWRHLGPGAFLRVARLARSYWRAMTRREKP